MSSFVTKERYEEIKLKYPLIEGKVCVNILITPDPNAPVEKQLSGNCKKYHKGTMKEMSIYDDMDGMLTYHKCGVRAKN
jgi:hypothetical protein